MKVLVELYGDQLVDVLEEMAENCEHCAHTYFPQDKKYAKKLRKAVNLIIEHCGGITD